MEVTSSSYGNYSASSGSTASAAQSSDYITFLQMLTTQMQNQDPLNPMEASDFAVQLATFANVEQSTYTNQLLSAMMTQTGLSDLGDWVGMEARIFGGAYFDGSPIELTPDPALGADEVTLVVRDGSGVIVDSRSIDPESQSYSWDGTGSDGNPLPSGSYTFEIESKADGNTLDTTPVAAYVPIMEARYEGGSTMLVLPGNYFVDSSSVTGLRRPVNEI